MAVTATLNWTPILSAENYFVQYRQEGSSTWLTPEGVNPTVNSFFVIDGLTEGTTYEFKVTTECCSGSSDDIFEGTTSCPATSPLNVTVLGQNFVLDWTPVDYAFGGYNVYYKETSSPTWILHPDSPTTFDNQTITGLELATSYDFAVEVICNDNISLKSIASSIIPCPSVTNLVVSFTTNTANVGWSGIAGQLYKVEYKRNVDPTFTVFAASQSGTTANITGLQYNVPYTFQVTALCDATPAIPVQIGGTATCPQITMLTNVVTEQDVALNWILGFPTQQVKVEYKITTDSTYTLAVDNLNASSYTITDLIPGYTYDIRVTGKCGTFEVNSLTTQAIIACPGVTDLEAINL